MPSLAIVVPSVYNSELCKKNATAADPWALEWTKNNSAGSRRLQGRVASSPSEQVVLVALRRLEGRHAAEGRARHVPRRRGRRHPARAGGDAAMPTCRRTCRRARSPTSAPPRSSGGIGARWPTPSNISRCRRSSKPFDDVRVRQAIAYAHPLPEGDRQRRVRARPADVRRIRVGARRCVLAAAVSLHTRSRQGQGAAARTPASRRASRPSCSSTRRWRPSTSRRRSSSRTRSASSGSRSRSKSSRTSPRAATRRAGRWRSTCSAPGSTIRISSSAGSGTARTRSGTWRATRTPRWTSLLDAARQERDGAAYASLAKQFIKLAMTDVPVIPLYQPMLDVVCSPTSRATLHVPPAGRRAPRCIEARHGRAEG